MRPSQFEWYCDMINYIRSCVLWNVEVTEREKKMLDASWYKLTDEEKERAPSIPFPTIGVTV